MQELGDSDYQNFNKDIEDFFTDQNSMEQATESSTSFSLPVQLPDPGSIMENENRNGLLQRPTTSTPPQDLEDLSWVMWLIK